VDTQSDVEENEVVNQKQNASEGFRKESSFKEKSVSKSLEKEFQDPQITSWSYCFILLLVILGILNCSSHKSMPS
jgi:hypothetical protein